MSFLSVCIVLVGLSQPTFISGFGDPQGEGLMWDTLKHISDIMAGNYAERTDEGNYAVLEEAEGLDPEITRAMPLFWIPAYGTLLGLVRQGVPVDGDDDVDIFAFENDRTEITRRLNASGYVMQYNFGTFLRFSHYTPETGEEDIATAVDIWLLRPTYSSALEAPIYCHLRWDYNDENAGTFLWQSDVATKRMNLAENQEFTRFGETIYIPVPLRPERFLVDVYGEDWRTPSGFKGLWVNIDDFFTHCGNVFLNPDDDPVKYQALRSDMGPLVDARDLGGVGRVFYQNLPGVSVLSVLLVAVACLRCFRAKYSIARGL